MYMYTYVDVNKQPHILYITCIRRRDNTNNCFERLRKDVKCETIILTIGY